MKKPIKTLFSWCMAAFVAVLVANGISFFYRSGAGSIDRENAYSYSIRTPNSWMVRGSEGYGINRVDQNGYLNDDTLPRKDNYILLMGSSHAEGLQVMQKDSMTAELNHLIDPTTRTVYNLGTAGYTLPLIMEGFQAALDEFPNSSAVMIEISDLSFSSEDFLSAMKQTQFDPACTGQALAQSLNPARRVRNDLLRAIPLISLLRQQFDSMNFSMKDAFGIRNFFKAQEAPAPDPNSAQAAEAENAAAKEAAAFSSALNQAFALLRSEYDKPIILLYHAGVSILPDGTIQINRDMRYYDAYRAACEQNGIVFVDAGDAFLAAYQADFSLPYGFSNTTMRGGHLNKLGHKIVAEEFYKAWRNIQEEEKN
ncbi:MAG: hypothetical protein PHW41_03690 [Eubacteriales bacterium]|nr:hypothetical protein [Eubacteriales bacterium]